MRQRYHLGHTVTWTGRAGLIRWAKDLLCRVQGVAMKPTLLLLLVSLAGGPSAAQETPSISGTVKLKGERPKAKPIKINCPSCGPLYPGGMPREDLMVDDKNLIQSAFVYVKAGLEGKKFEVPKVPVVLEQKGCRYEPHVVGLMVGQKLLIRNSDPHNHCTHGIAFQNKESNLALLPEMEYERVFERPEVSIAFKDDVYPWMRGWVAVVEHPFFAVTGPGGKFEIKGLPAGKYTLEVWQEKCVPLTFDIELKASEKQTLDLGLDPKKE